MQAGFDTDDRASKYNTKKAGGGTCASCSFGRADYPRVAMRLEPANVQLIGGELAIQWKDGAESYLPLERLRRACPCATCGGEPDVLGNLSRPDVSYTPSSFELLGWEMIGGYALLRRLTAAPSA